MGSTLNQLHAWPRITLVTPCFQSERFLRASIESVLAQGYPNLEFFLVDGGSDDRTVEIIREYESKISWWTSEPDDGPAHAINKGLERATGTWFNWLNSDDLLLPGSLSALARINALIPEAQWISGLRVNIAEDGTMGGLGGGWLTNPAFLAMGVGHLPQEATFIRKDLLDRHNIILDTTAGNAFDKKLQKDIINIAKPTVTTAVLSAMRWYPGQLTSAAIAQSKNRAPLTTHATKRRKILRGSLPVIHETLLRGRNSRLRPVFNILIALFNYYGFFSYGRDIKACVYNRWHLDYEIYPARKVLLNELLF
jgi:glycosyltransferase involved in cell wall biosynthesis